MVNDRLLYNIAKLIVLGLVVHLFIIAFVIWSNYEGRKDLVTSQRRGCERGKLDRNDNAGGWRSAEAARRASGDIQVAIQYQALAERLEARGRIDCERAFPKASLIP